MKKLIYSLPTGRNITYTFDPTLDGGYWNPKTGWHLLKKDGVLVYNIDPTTGNPFFNKVVPKPIISVVYPISREQGVDLASHWINVLLKVDFRTLYNVERSGLIFIGYVTNNKLLPLQTKIKI